MCCTDRGTRGLVAGLLLVLPGVFLLGCDRSVPRNPEVPTDKRILWLVEDVDDRSHSPGELHYMTKVFAPGCEPSSEMLSRYTAYRYKGQSPVQSGDSATVAVALTEVKTGNPAGEMQWSMIKIDDTWKIKDAPLPAAAGGGGFGVR